MRRQVLPIILVGLVPLAFFKPPPPPLRFGVGNRRSFSLYHRPHEEKLPFLGGPFDALAFRLLEGLGVRDIDVVGSTMEARDLSEDLDMRLLELVIDESVSL